MRIIQVTWLGAIVAAVAVACGVTDPGSRVLAPQEPGLPVTERGAAEPAWRPITLQPTGARRLLATDTWATADRWRVGSLSSLWGDAPLGYGFRTGGILPYVSRSGGRDGVSFFDFEDRTVYQVPALSRDARNPVIAGGGRFIVFEEDDELGVLDLETQLIQTFDQPFRSRSGLRSFDIDAFGNIAYADRRGQLNLFDPRTGDNFRVPAAGRDVDVEDVTISPDGRYVFYVGRDDGRREIYVTDVEQGRQYSVPFVRSRGSFFGSSFGRRSFSASSDGRQLLFDDGGEVRLLDLRTGFTDRLALLNQGGRIRDAEFLDADGDRIAFERDGRLQVYDRRTNLIDTLPIVNRDRGDVSLFGRSNFGPLF